MALVAVLSTYERAYDEREQWYDNVSAFLESVTDSRPLRVVTFNYDRSFEFFVARSIEKHHQLSMQAARERFQRVVTIEHVYGYIANLPHLSQSRGLTVEYAQLTGHDLWKAGLEAIQLIGDAMPDGEHISRTKQWISESDYVIVLGFGFDHANVNLIGLDSLSAGKFLFCSGFKLNAETRNQVRWSCTPARVHFARQDANISTFFQSSRLLSSALTGEPAENAYARLGPGTP